MKSLLTLSLIVISSFGYTQYCTFPGGCVTGSKQGEEYPIAYVPKKQVKEVRFAISRPKYESVKYREYDEKGRVVSIGNMKENDKYPYYTYKYDEENRLFAWSTIDKNREWYDMLKYVYNENGKKVREQERNHKGKLQQNKTWTYNENDQLVEYYRKWGDKVWNHDEYKYDEKGNRIEALNYFNKKKPYKDVYEYYENGQQKSRARYKPNGKLISKTSFDCNPIGVLEDKKGSQTSKCLKWEDYGNDYIREIDESYTNSGVYYKRVSTYTKDSMLVRKDYYSKNRLLSKMICNNEGNSIRFTSYGSNSINSDSHRIYKDGNLALETSWADGKVIETIEYSYFDNGMLKEVKKYGAKGKWQETIQMDYKF